MGEAKRRGTFEQRKAEAVKEEAILKGVREQRKRRVQTMRALAMLAGMGYIK